MCWVYYSIVCARSIFPSRDEPRTLVCQTKTWRTDGEMFSLWSNAVSHCMLESPNFEVKPRCPTMCEYTCLVSPPRQIATSLSNQHSPVPTIVSSSRFIKFKLRVGLFEQRMPLFRGSYKNPFAPRSSGFKLSAMPAHSLDPRLSSGAGPLASASDKVSTFPCSPVKDRVKITNAKGIENSDQVRGASILPGKQFTELHLTSPPKQWSSSRTELRDSWDDMVGPIRTHTGCEEGLYKPICTLLNDINKWTHSTCL